MSVDECKPLVKKLKVSHPYALDTPGEAIDDPNPDINAIFPAEIFQHIFSFLSIVGVYLARNVCRTWRILIPRPKVIKNYYKLLLHELAEVEGKDINCFENPIFLWHLDVGMPIDIHFIIGMGVHVDERNNYAKMLFNHSRFPGILTELDNFGISMLLMYLKENSELICAVKNTVAANICEDRHTLLQPLSERKLFEPLREICETYSLYLSSKVLLDLAGMGDVEVLRWLYNNTKYWVLGVRDEIDIARFFRAILFHHTPEVIDEVLLGKHNVQFSTCGDKLKFKLRPYFCTKRGSILSEEYLNVDLLDVEKDAGYQGCLDTLRWINSKNEIPFDHQRKILTQAAKFKRKQILRWALENKWKLSVRQEQMARSKK